jgi:hypothetical protein
MRGARIRSYCEECGRPVSVPKARPLFLDGALVPVDILCRRHRRLAIGASLDRFATSLGWWLHIKREGK